MPVQASAKSANRLVRYAAGVCAAIGLAAGTAAQAQSAPAPTLGNPPAGTIRLTFLGTGAPRPSELRSGPAILVEAGTHKFLIDAGSGTREQLFRARGWAMITGLDTIFVTHLHYDHTVDIADISLTGWQYGRGKSLKVYGPEGTVAMANHLDEAFRWDKEHRILVGVPGVGSEIEAHDIKPGVVMNADGVTVTAFDVEHMPIDIKTGKRLPFHGETIGFRVDYAGHSVVFSGDTRSTPKSEIIKYGQGVDVLVHEVQVPSANATKEANLANVSLSVHSTPEQAGYVFSQTHPKLAVYSHIIPPETTAEALKAVTKPFYDGSLLPAEDFMTITVGDDIKVGRSFHEGASAFEQSDAVKFKAPPN